MFMLGVDCEFFGEIEVRWVIVNVFEGGNMFGVYRYNKIEFILENVNFFILNVMEVVCCVGKGG